MRLSKITSIALAGTLALGLSACSNDSADKSSSVSIKLADILPKSHYISKGFTQYLIDQIEDGASTEGKKINIGYFPDGQLGEAADQIDNMKNGIFDAGLVASPYDPSHMPLSDAYNLPFMADNAEILAKAYYQVLQDKDSAIYKRDYKKNGIVPIATFALPTYQIVMTSSIDGPSVLKGKKIRSGGGVQNDTIKALGGTPVTLTTPEQYEGLQRGIIDGGIFNLPSMIDNKTAEVTKSFTTNVNMGGFNGAIAITEKTWKSLPSWAQTIIQEAGKNATEHFADTVVKLNDDAKKKLVKDFNLKAVEFTDAQLQTLESKLKPVDEAWVEQMKKSKADGAAALSEAHESVAAQG